MIKKSAFWIASAAIALFFLTHLSLALTSPMQAEDEDRRVWDSEFLKKRKTSNNKPPAVARQLKYKRITPPVKLAKQTGPFNTVGVTVWKLRRPAQADSDDVARILERVDEDSETTWVAERTDPNTPLAEGQRVRLTVEVPRSGYLYMIDREQYADGSYGDPYLVFPIKRNRGIENNEVKAGTPIEFPSQEDKFPYFIVKKSRPDHVGEALTLLVTPTPLTGVEIGTKNLKLTREQFEQWEKQWGTQVEIHQRIDGEGEVYRKKEMDAAKRRVELDQDDPLPQTIIRYAGKPEDPVLVNLSLRVKN